MLSHRPAVVCLPAHRSVLHLQNCNIEHYAQTFQPDSLVSAMLVSTIYLYHFIPQLISLTSQLIRIKFGVALEQSELNSRILLLSGIYIIKGNNCCLTDWIYNFNFSMQFNIC